MLSQYIYDEVKSKMCFQNVVNKKQILNMDCRTPDVSSGPSVISTLVPIPMAQVNLASLSCAPSNVFHAPIVCGVSHPQRCKKRRQFGCVNQSNSLSDHLPIPIRSCRDSEQGSWKIDKFSSLQFYCNLSLM